MMSEQTVQAAMSIILNAGDARVACKEALDAILILKQLKQN